jgi:hypothetical protein
MKAEGVDVITNERQEWDNIEEVHQEMNERYYTLIFEDGTSESFDGFIDFISK